MNYFGIEITEQAVADKLMELRAAHDQMLGYGEKVSIEGIVEDLWWENADEETRKARADFVIDDYRIDGGEFSAVAYLGDLAKRRNELHRIFSDVLGNPTAFLPAKKRIHVS